MQHKNKAIFLDRDGTLNIDYDFVHKPREWDWIPGVPQILYKLKMSGYKLIVVTNQSGVARKKFTLSDVHHLHKHVDENLKKRYNFMIDGWYIAPWHPDFHNGKDDALLYERKPGTALFLKAAEQHGIDIKGSVMVGDKSTDLQPALELGMRPFLVKSRFYDDNLQLWCREKGIPVYKDLVQLYYDKLSRNEELLDN
ncbi:MAG: HAD family hydrolase [Balneolales bacterium]|nr:HAD family hydrolase [Balneolales bacterium]